MVTFAFSAVLGGDDKGAVRLANAIEGAIAKPAEQAEHRCTNWRREIEEVIVKQFLGFTSKVERFELKLKVN